MTGSRPWLEGSGTLDATDSSALRAAFELCQAGFGDVRYVRGGLPGALEDGGFAYESEKWGDFLRWLDEWNPDQRRLLMYSRLGRRSPAPHAPSGFRPQEGNVLGERRIGLHSLSLSLSLSHSISQCILSVLQFLKLRGDQLFTDT